MALSTAEETITLCGARQPTAAVTFKTRKGDFQIQTYMLIVLSDLQKRTENELREEERGTEQQHKAKNLAIYI